MPIGTNNWGYRNYMNKPEKGSIYLGKSMFLATISCQFKVIVSFKNIPEQNCSVLVPCLNSKSVKDIQMLRKVAQMTTILTIKSSFIWRIRLQMQTNINLTRQMMRKMNRDK